MQSKQRQSVKNKVRRNSLDDWKKQRSRYTCDDDVGVIIPNRAFRWSR